MADDNSYNMLPHGILFTADGFGPADEMLERGAIWGPFTQELADLLFPNNAERRSMETNRLLAKDGE